MREKEGGLCEGLERVWGKAPGEGGVPRIGKASRGQGEGFPPKEIIF